MCSQKEKKGTKVGQKNSSRFSRCQETSGVIGRAPLDGQWSKNPGILSRRHVRRTRQGTDAYYKSRRGPVRKGNVGGEERGKKTRPAGMRGERKDRTRGRVCVNGSMRSRSYITRQYLRRTTVNQWSHEQRAIQRNSSFLPVYTPSHPSFPVRERNRPSSPHPAIHRLSSAKAMTPKNLARKLVNTSNETSEHPYFVNELAKCFFYKFFN